MEIKIYGGILLNEEVLVWHGANFPYRKIFEQSLHLIPAF
jgi:hypothetical protein